VADCLFSCSCSGQFDEVRNEQMTRD
jgi:hypothetical protein